MGQKNYLLDSNVIIDYLLNRLSPKILENLYKHRNVTCFTSIICKIEILGHESAYNNQVVNEFINDASIIDLDSLIVDKTIEIRRKYKTKIADAIIAATCLVHKYILVTHNMKDFRNIENLELIDPYEIESKIS